MKKNIIFLITVLIISFSLSAQDTTGIKIEKYIENIIIDNIDSGFVRDVYIYGVTEKKIYFNLVTIDEVNDLFTDFHLYYKKKKKYKEVEDCKVYNSSNLMQFHNSKLFKIISIDSGMNFMCKFKISCSNTMLLSNIILSRTYKTDSVFYRINFPLDANIKYDPVNTDSLFFFEIKHKKNATYQCLNIKAKPNLFNPDEHNYKIAILRLILMPGSFTDENRYFNYWYLSSIKNKIELDQNSKYIIDSVERANLGNSDLLSLYYDFVRSDFKYLDVQIGMGAFIPRDVNLILKNRQGDCKDLSNLLSAIFRYKGFNSNLAFAATYNHLCDFDFASLCSGNHLICTVKKNDSILLFDPTDINHLLGTPVFSLQGKTIFITDKNSPYFYKVPILDQKKNTFFIDIDFISNGNVLDGYFRIKASGNLSYSYRRTIKNANKAIADQEIKYSTISILNNETIDSLKYQINRDTIEVTGKLKVYNKVYKVNTITYFFIDFIPKIFPREFHDKKIIAETYLGSTISKKISMNVIINKDINKLQYEPLAIKDSVFCFNIEAKKTNKNCFKLEYNFTYKKLWINIPDLAPINSLIDKFNKKINETIVLLN